MGASLSPCTLHLGQHSGTKQDPSTSSLVHAAFYPGNRWVTLTLKPNVCLEVPFHVLLVCVFILLKFLCSPLGHFPDHLLIPLVKFPHQL